MTRSIDTPYSTTGKDMLPSYPVRRAVLAGVSATAIGLSLNGCNQLSANDSDIPTFATCEGTQEVAVTERDDYGSLTMANTDFRNSDGSPVSPADVTRVLKGLEFHNNPDDEEIPIPVGNLVPAGNSLAIQGGDTTKVPEVCIIER